MQYLTFVCLPPRICRLIASVILLLSTTGGAQTLTWDADSVTGGQQNGSGVWNTSNTNWLSGSTNPSWVNSTTAIADIGGGVITTTGTSTAPITITVQTDIQLTTLNFRGFTTTPTSYNIYTLQGDVAGRTIDFGTNGLIQLENLSSGGSQFVTLGANLRLKGSNLRIQKYGSGTTFQYISLSMISNPNLTGTFTLGGSIYATITSPGTLQAVDRIVVEAGGSAALSGVGANYTQAFSLAGIGNSLTFSGTAYGAIRLVSNNITLSGPITLTADAGIHTNFSGSNGFSGTISGVISDNGSNFSFNRFTFTRGGDSVLTLTGANTYGGATILGRNLASYSGGTTVLDFSAAGAPQNNILYNGLTTPGNLALASGNSATTLRLVGNAGQTNSQAFKDLSISGAYNVLELISGTGGTMNLSFGNISRVETTAVLAVLAPLSGTISTTQTAGFSGPWMSFTSAYGARSWAQIVGGAIVGGYTGDTVFATGQNLGAPPFTATSNATITSGTTGAVTAGAGITYLNTLTTTDITAGRLVQIGAGQTLRLGTQGGIQLLNGAQDLTVGTAGAASTLSAGGTVTTTAGVLFLTNLSSTGTLTINSAIANNGTGIVTLVSNGAPGTRTVLTAVNTFTGSIQISSGILEMRNAGALGTTGAVTILDGATLALSGNITVSRALANVEGFGDGGNGAIRSLSGTNTITGLMTLAAPALITADAGAVLNLGTVAATSILNGSNFLNFGGAGTINVGGSIGAVAGFVKTGLGTLVLSGANTFTGAITVNLGTLKLGTATTLGTASVALTSGGVADLNGFSVSSAFSLAGAGSGSGAIISSSGPGTLTGAFALTASALLGGDLTINNAGGLTGNVLLTKTGGGTLTFISTATSTRSGTTQIDAGTLRLQAAAASIAPIGTGTFALNGGTLSLGFDTTTIFTNVVNLIKDSTIIADRASAGAGGTVTTLSTLTMGANTLTVKAGSNVNSSTIGLTLGSVSIGGVSMRPGNPVFDVQSTASATTVLTLGALNDQAIAARTLTFQNSGTAASVVTLGVAASSLVDGTIINLASTGGGLTLNLNLASVLGTLTQVNVGTGNTLNLGAAQTFGSLSGSGNITGAFVLTVGNASTASALNTTYSGVLGFGGVATGLTKSGLGTLTLSGTNAYTGATILSLGTLKLNNASALGTTSGVTISAGGTLDLNGQSTDRSFTSVSGTGINSGGAIINSSSTTGTMTGTVVLAAVTSIGGSGNITINNSTGVTGNVQLTKIGTGTLTIIDTLTTSARTGANQLNAGTLRLESATTAVSPLGTSGAWTLNGGTLSLGFDFANALMTGAVTLNGNATVITDVATLNNAAVIQTMGALTINNASTLTVKTGSNVASGGTQGMTFGAVTLNGNATFDIQNSAAATTRLTMLAFSDLAIGPRTITFTNTGAATTNSLVTLGTLATSLVDGTVVNLNNGTNAGVTLNLNVVGALGSLAQVNVNGSSVLTVGITNIVLGSLAGNGTVNASGAFTLIVGNSNSSTPLNTNFSGVIANGSGTLALTKNGTGTLTLSGSTSNSYTGATQVNTGTLVLAKTDGAIAIGLVPPPTPPATGTTVSLTIGAAAASTAGNATVRLEADNQMAITSSTDAGALTINAGGTLDLNGHTLTVTTLTGFYGSTITGGGTLVINRTGGTIGFSGINSISSTLQITTANSSTAARTIAVGIGSVADRLTISGNITQGVFSGSIVAGNGTGTAIGTVILTGTNSYTGATTVSSGILNIRNGSALGTTATGTSVTTGGTLQIQGSITTLAEALTLNGAGFVGSNGINIQTGAFVNVSGTNNYAGLVTLASAATISSDSGTLNLTNTSPISGATFALTLAGAGDGSISSLIGTTTGSVIKNGTGTWTLKGLNTSTGSIMINAGTLKLGDGTTGGWSSAPGLTYTGSGTFEYGGSTTATTQALGILTLTSGNGTLKVDAPASGTNALAFTSLATPALGSGLNIVSPTNTSVTIAGTTNTNGIVDPRITYNGADFAASTAGLIGAATTTTATSSLTAGNLSPYLISGSFAQTSSVTINAGLKFSGGDSLTISNGTLLTINNGANTAGGILVTGGVAAVIADGGGASGLTTGGSGDLVIGTNAAGDSLSIQVSIATTTTGGITKNGAGTLTLTVANAYTGATSINAGTLILGNATAMSSSVATVQVGGVLDLNGKLIINTATLNGTGIGNGGALVNNSGTASSIGALTIGQGNGTGGIGASIGGTGSITSTGTLTGDNLLVKTGAGTLTFGNNAGAALASTRIGATRIDAGTLRISNSSSAIGTTAAAIILNGGTLSLGSVASVVAYPVSVTASSTIVSDVFTAGAGLTHTLGVLAIGAQTLTVQAGSNVTTTGTNAGITFGATTLLDNPTFDVQSPTSATNGTTTLTLGALSDLGVARTISFTNTGNSTINSSVILNAAMASLIDGTVVNLNAGTNAGVTLNLNIAAALGTLAQVTVSGNSVLSLGAAQTIGSLAGDGNIIGAFALTVGNANSGTVYNTTYSGVLGFGGVATGLVKSGLGTLTLSGANAYTGTTTISLGILKLNNASALGATSGVTISAGGTLDLNGQSTNRNFTSVSGTGINSGGAIINSSSTTATITGTVVLAAATSIGGSGNITINNSTGVTGNFQLTKIGTGTLTIIDTLTSSARTGANQLNAGTLRLESAFAAAVSPLGTSGVWTLNGGTLSLGFNTANALMTGAVTLNGNTTIITDVATMSNAAVTHTLGALTVNNNSTLTVKTGANVVAAGIQGLTLGAVTLNGNAIFDVQNSSSATTRLTMLAFSDLAIAPRTITFTNTGAATTNSLVTLGTLATSLVDGTVVNLNNGTNAGVTLNLNVVGALGSLAQVNVNGNSVLTAGITNIVLGSLAGNGTVNASGSFILIIGNTSSATALSSDFSGTLSNGSGTLALTKSGLGTLTLSGTNSYSGATIASLGILKLNSASALGATNGVTISAGGTVDLNGQTTDRNFISISGTGHSGLGALINSSSTTATITGTTVLGAASKIGGSGNIIISNAGGLTGSVLLTKFGSGTLTITSTSASARSGTNQIDEGTLRLQGATALNVVGAGTMAMNGGTLSLGFDTTGTVGGAVNVLADSTIIIDRATTGAGGTTLTLGAVIIGGNTLTVQAGDNVTTGTIGLTLTTVTIGGPSLAPGNPTFDVKSSSSANAILTLGALTDQAIAPRTITFQNSGTGSSSVILATAAGSLLDGTQINLAGTGGAITLNLNNAIAIGTFAQVTMAAGNTLALGTSQTISSLNGSGTVTATANSVLTLGNPQSQTMPDSTFNGALTGTNLSVVKAGTGKVTLGGNTDNTFSGSSGLAVNSGTLVLAKTSGAVAVSSKLIIGTVGAAYGSATVQLAGASQIATTATVTMNAQSFLDLNGYNTTLGALIGTPGGTILNNATGTTTTLTVGAGDTTGQHLGQIVDNTSGTGTVAVTKTGSGAFALGGWNTYTGATLVQAGSLQVGLTGMGTTGSGSVTVQNGATLFGTGVIQGSSFTAATGSTVQAGDGTAQSNYGTLTFQPMSGSGTLDFQAGSTIILGLNPGGTSDLLNIVGTGSTTLLFSGNLTVTATAFTPTAPAVFNLLDWSGLTSAPVFDSRYSYTGGLYGNGDESSGFDLPDIAGSGYIWDISSFTTNGTIALVLVPEPSRWVLLGLSLGMLLLRRRR